MTTVGPRYSRTAPALRSSSAPCLDFVRHYGFQIKAYGPANSQSAGIVENAVRHVKLSFLHGRELNAYAERGRHFGRRLVIEGTITNASWMNVKGAGRNVRLRCVGILGLRK